ncbi:hypothetical protein [Mesorhizobium sp. M7A.F.Ca.US.008.03.1.1]|uniref:hypothetical protein n=1 Tax=Mesorhizobium sp. M7A.F.Ca.US.008.03.1.1 TaxID=2496742 RepID=UPI001FE12927|nr:hypothetical protein [Mesorhizobium sp. M7A.F.Ca.US.008.03.1.1]
MRFSQENRFTLFLELLKVPAMALVRMLVDAFEARALRVAVTPSPRTLRAELLRLCARIGYSPPLRL